MTVKELFKVLNEGVLQIRSVEGFVYQLSYGSLDIDDTSYDDLEVKAIDVFGKTLIAYV